MFVFLVCLRAHPFRDILLSLSCRVVCCFLCSCLCVHWACFSPFFQSLSLVLAFALPRAGLAFAFVVRCQTVHSGACFACVQFSFDNLSPCDRELHTMNCSLGTFDLGCLTVGPWQLVALSEADTCRDASLFRPQFRSSACQHFADLWNKDQEQLRSTRASLLGT